MVHFCLWIFLYLQYLYITKLFGIQRYGDVEQGQRSWYSFEHWQAYEKQKNEKKTEMAELTKAAKESKVKSFLDKELSIVSKPLNPFDHKAGRCVSRGFGQVLSMNGQRRM